MYRVKRRLGNKRRIIVIKITQKKQELLFAPPQNKTFCYSQNIFPFMFSYTSTWGTEFNNVRKGRGEHGKKGEAGKSCMSCNNYKLFH